MKTILDIVRGIVIGIANVIPGVSGGTMAVSMGIYYKLIGAINGLTKNFMRSVRILAPLLVGMAIGVVVFLFAPQLIAAFDATPAVVAFGIGKARTAALFYCLLAYSHAVAAVLRGAGKALTPMIVMMVFWCAVRVVFLTVTVPLTHSIQMVYWVYPLTWSLSSVVFFFYYRRGHWATYG